MNDSLGDRMKKYENIYRNYLIPKIPVIIRLDGKAFHTLTRKYCKSVFDEVFYNSMLNGVMMVKNTISQGFQVAYFQSDEVSILLSDLNKHETQGWFDYNIQKMVSIAASAMSLGFSNYFGHNGIFDGRAFNIPIDDVPNYFLWRVQDCKRNSIQSFSRMFFSHRELMNKNQNDMHDMLHKIGKNWATDVPPKYKNGTFYFDDEHIFYDLFPNRNYWAIKDMFESYTSLYNKPVD